MLTLVQRLKFACQEAIFYTDNFGIGNKADIKSLKRNPDTQR